MRILLTGAAGFIGSHLAEELLDAGHRVTGIDNFSDYYPRVRKEANIETARDAITFRFIETDILRPDESDVTDELAEALTKTDAVFHLAARPGVRASWGAGFQAYARDNIVATHALMQAAKRAGVSRVVYASSSSVYGDDCPLPMAEEGPCVPASPYGFTKLAGERIVSEFARETGAIVAIMRLFSVYGPRQRPDMAFQRAIEAADLGEPLEVFGDGNQTRDFTYIVDVADALARTLTLEESFVGNVGGGTRLSLAEALRVLGDVMGKPVSIREAGVQAGDVRDTEASTERMAEALGWSARIPLEQGLARQVEWWERSRERFVEG